jgi:hypothetical protein
MRNALAWLGCFLRISRYIELQDSLAKLERDMEIEPHL